MTELEPITPHQALEMYLQEIDGELSPNTIYARESQLGFFTRWCDGADTDTPRVENLNNLTGRDLTRFKNWRSTGINKVTLKGNLSALREFMRFCVSIDAVDQTIPEKINVPVLDQGENRREEIMSVDRATSLLSYLGKYEYAGLDHTLFLLQWTTGMRMSGLHSLDLADVDEDTGTLHAVHRPDEGTRLKNKHDGNRVVVIADDVMEVVSDYIEHKRVVTTDEYGRQPLFSSTKGRLAKSSLNKHVYSLTRPCAYGAPCPSDMDVPTCEHNQTQASHVTCPHNLRPHSIRRGAITSALRDEVPEKAISDRMNVAIKTLDKHYDQRSEAEKAEMRREYFEG